MDDHTNPYDAQADELTNMYDDWYDDEVTNHDGTNLAQFTAHASFGSPGPTNFMRRVAAEISAERSSFLHELAQKVRLRRADEAAGRDSAGNLQTDNIGDDLQGTQRHAYEYITAALAVESNADQLRVAIMGEAGTGKSKLIHAITRFARLTIHPDAACVMAMMGCAAYSVRGATVHSTLNFSVHEKGVPANLLMSDKTRDKLSTKFANVNIIIVDEVSLVDVTMLNAIDVSLKQIKKGNAPFGGIHIVFLGDFYQLHPIKNMPLFRAYENEPVAGSGNNAALALAGRKAWLTVNVAFELNVNYRQQADTTGFIDTLRTARIGEAPTKAQLTRLNSRSCSLSAAFQRAGDDALWVTHENKSRAKINDADLRRANAAGSPTVHVWAQHSRKATRSASTIDAQRASLTPHERKKLTHKDDGLVQPVVLPSLLRLAIGARVALTKNADNTVGTYNGASGTLVALEYDSNVCDEQLRLSYDQVVRGDPVPPIPVALVRFDSIDHKAPNDPSAHTCDENIGGNVVPVFPITSTIVIDNKKFERRQLPLVLARATTIHKAQGRSVDNLVYAPTKPFGSGQAYVALSRVTRLQGLHIIQQDSHSELPIVPVDDALFTAYNDRLTAVGNEMTRLRNLTPPSDDTPPPGSTSSQPARTAHAPHARPRSSDPREPDGPPQRRARR
jgi:ATP-dependent DNA helicase PIF1